MSAKPLPPIVDAETWDAARLEILAQEKAVTRARDALAAARRRLPMVEVTRGYSFVGPEGATDLPGLFAGFDQLSVYHHMLKAGDPAPCPGCCMFADNVGHLAHLNARNTRFVMVSRAPINEITAFRQRMGWTMPFYSTVDNFNGDFNVATGFGLNVFLRDGERIFRTYFITDRAAEAIGNVWSLLDLTPYGRQESWEDSPAGWPQTKPYQWWRRHDEY